MPNVFGSAQIVCLSGHKGNQSDQIATQDNPASWFTFQNNKSQNKLCE